MVILNFWERPYWHKVGQIAARSRGICEKLTVPQLILIFLILWNQILITVVTAARHLSPPSPDRSARRPSSCFLRSIFMLFSRLHLGLPPGLLPAGFPTTALYAFLFCLIVSQVRLCNSLFDHLVCSTNHQASHRALVSSPLLSSVLLDPNVFLSTCSRTSSACYCNISIISIPVPSISYYFVLWPTNAQLFHKLSHCYMFRHYRVILRQLVINTFPSYTGISSASVGSTIYN